MDYIYLLREREFIKLNEYVYKIGKSKQEFGKRLNDYPKDSEVLLTIKVVNCDITEQIIISKFKDSFKHRDDIGAEYFEGDIKEMMQIIFNIGILQIENKVNSEDEKNKIKFLKMYLILKKSDKIFKDANILVQNDINNIRTKSHNLNMKWQNIQRKFSELGIKCKAKDVEKNIKDTEKYNQEAEKLRNEIDRLQMLIHELYHLCK